MAEAIQFPCPACGATLRLPLAMAAFQGPCPRCQQEIVAPDPASGTAAYLPAPPPLTETPPVADPLPAIRETVAAPAEVAVSEPAARSCRCYQRAILLLSVLLTAVVSLVAGFLIGNHFGTATNPPAVPVLPSISAPPMEVTVPAKGEAPPPPAPAPAPAEAAQPEKKPETVRASATAEASLKAFLDAPDWSSRAAYVLDPEAMRPAMEDYSHKAPDGPTPYKSVSLQNSYTDKNTGNTLFIFKVITESHPTGIPVAVAERPSGWLVDWRTFIEFRDDLFRTLAEGPAGQSGRFHLIVRASPPPRSPNSQNEHFASFLLDPPFPDCQQTAYVKKTSGILPTLEAATAEGAIFTPVLDVAKRNAPDGTTYLEITDLVAKDWLPESQ